MFRGRTIYIAEEKEHLKRNGKDGEFHERYLFMKDTT